MRYAFIQTLEQLAAKDKNIMLLTGDLGFTVFENFVKKFPKQFINMGVAEANMVSVAAGLASTGKIPFVYSIATFMSMRPFEQIRNDVASQKMNVKIVGVGGGLSYGYAGLTHHSLEDIALMRTINNMTILCPSDPILTKLAVENSVALPGPVYIRLGKAGEPKIYEKPKFKIGKGITIKEGKDLTIIATGNQVYTALLVSRELEKEGIEVGLIDMHTIKPLDEKLIIATAKNTKKIITIEEHNIIGGLGSSVAEVLAHLSSKTVLKRFGVIDSFKNTVGDQEYLRKMHRLTVPLLRKDILKFIKNA